MACGLRAFVALDQQRVVALDEFVATARLAAQGEIDQNQGGCRQDMLTRQGIRLLYMEVGVSAPHKCRKRSSRVYGLPRNIPFSSWFFGFVCAHTRAVWFCALLRNHAPCVLALAGRACFVLRFSFAL